MLRNLSCATHVAGQYAFDLVFREFGPRRIIPTGARRGAIFSRISSIRAPLGWADPIPGLVPVGPYHPVLVDHLRESIIESMEETLSVMGTLRSKLKATEASYRRGIENLREGSSIEDSLHSIAASATRSSLNAKLEELELSRHRARLAMIAGGLHEGLSIGEIGRILGVSRQLAARYAKETREQSATEAGESGSDI
jgi:hypothetical protein